MTAVVVDKAMIDNNPFVKQLVSQYFNAEPEDIEHKLNYCDKLIETKRRNAYNYFLKSKTDPEIKKKMDENRRLWYQRHKEEVQQKRKDKMRDDKEYREKVNAQKREMYRIKTAHVPKKKRGRKPKNEHTNESSDNTSDTSSNCGEENIQPSSECIHQDDTNNLLKNLSKEDVASLIQFLQSRVTEKS
jgi:hypothetical protein